MSGLSESSELCELSGVKISDTGVYGKIPALCPQRSSLGYIAIVYWIYYNYDYNYKAGCLLAATWNYISIR